MRCKPVIVSHVCPNSVESLGNSVLLRALQSISEEEEDYGRSNLAIPINSVICRAKHSPILDLQYIQIEFSTTIEEATIQ